MADVYWQHSQKYDDHMNLTVWSKSYLWRSHLWMEF